MKKLSILIPTIKRHGKYLAYLLPELRRQVKEFNDSVEILIDSNEEYNRGTKRNRLLDKAQGEYITSVDADDLVANNYISLLMEGINKGVDCCSLKGIITTNEADHHYFEHSIKYNEYKTVKGTKFEFGEIHYLRFPNHLNCIKASIGKRFKYPNQDYSEDTDWATQIHNSGLIKTEHYIPEVIYHYRYTTNKIEEPMKYSQSDEESFILDYFKDYTKGKMIDIGAYDVFRFSNIRALYETGKWDGVLVEPQPANYKAIAEHYKEDERITVLNVAIGETTGEIDFYESDGDAVGTTDIEHMKKWGAAGVKYTKIKVPQISVVDFMEQYGRGANFISIDTEFTNMVVFRNMPDWVWQAIQMVCIEYDDGKDEIEEKLSKFGFTAMHVNNENIILAKL